MLKGPGQPAKEKQMSTADLKDLDSLDLADPTVWDARPPYELFARRQREAPGHFSAQKTAPGEGGFWSITRAEHVRPGPRGSGRFSSDDRGICNLLGIGAPSD